jgi:glycosyltransferase involved in cell wall biosynthesis
MLTLTIVIPAYNEEGYLESCLAAIAKQSVRPDEVLVVDNNSSDRTLAIAGKFKFVKVVKEPRQGVLFARNRGFDAAKSDIIARIDADTILPARWVGRVKADFATSDFTAMTGPVNGYDLPFPRYNWLAHHLLCKLLQSWGGHPFLFGFNMAIRRSAWRRVRRDICDDPGMHEDLDLAIHLSRADGIIRYSRRMLASASGRRYNDSITDWARYISAYGHTYRRHGYLDPAVYLAETVYWLGYLAYMPWTFSRPRRKSPLT